MKKKLTLLLTSFVSVVAVVLSILFVNGHLGANAFALNELRTGGNSDPYVLRLDNTNNPVNANSNYLQKTFQTSSGNPVNINFSNIDYENVGDNWVVIPWGGHFNNFDYNNVGPIRAMTKMVINFSETDISFKLFYGHDSSNLQEHKPQQDYIGSKTLTTFTFDFSKCKFDYSAEFYDGLYQVGGHPDYFKIVNDYDNIPLKISSIEITYECSAGYKMVTCSSNNEEWGTVGRTLADVSAGSDVTVTATPKENCNFDYWKNVATDEIVSYDASYTFELNEDTNLLAHFSPATFDLTFHFDSTYGYFEEYDNTAEAFIIKYDPGDVMTAYYGQTRTFRARKKITTNTLTINGVQHTCNVVFKGFFNDADHIHRIDNNPDFGLDGSATITLKMTTDYQHLYILYVEELVGDDFIEYGEYPQTKVTDDALITSLNGLDDSAKEETTGWYVYNNNKYAKVVQNEQNQWFKVEPISWSIYKASDPVATTKNYYLVSKYILDRCEFFDFYSYAYRGRRRGGIKVNNYPNSKIRYMLNGLQGQWRYEENGELKSFDYTNKGFVDIAFKNNTDNLLTETTVNNSAISIAYADAKQYAHESCVDKVFLVSNAEYMALFSGKDYKGAHRTEYVTAKGLSNDLHWSRSPASSDEGTISALNYDHFVPGSADIISSNNGVRPAIMLSIPVTNS